MRKEWEEETEEVGGRVKERKETVDSENWREIKCVEGRSGGEE